MHNGSPVDARERAVGGAARGRHRAGGGLRQGGSGEVRPARQTVGRPRPRPHAGNRRGALTASAASIALVGSALFAMPTNAAIAAEAAPVVLVAAAEQHLQALTVGAVGPADGTGGARDRDDPVASAIAGVITAQGGAAGQQAASAITAALSASGPRQRIVATALTYLGDPYVLDGTSHAGIDCSGLVLVAYASAGIPLGHLVHLQDDAGVRIPEADALPGDLVVFDDEEHIGIYLGGGVLIQAPEEGRPVEITTVWGGVPHHFTRLLP